jgi:hypothetical protein
MSITKLFLCERGYSPDIETFQFCSALNSDSSFCVDCCDSPWLFAMWAFCFAEDNFFCQQNLIINFVNIVDLLAVLACRIKISLVLPVISYFVPVGYEQNVKEHVASKYCRTWRGFKDCLISRANGPHRVVKEDIGVIRVYCLGHIEFSCA